MDRQPIRESGRSWCRTVSNVWWIALLTSGGVAACLVPTDRSGELEVVLDAIPPLIEKDTFQLSASVLRDGLPVPNAEVRFSADNDTVLSVSSDGRLLAVGAGLANVTARAVTFAAAAPAVWSVQVRDVYELDSIGPPVVRYGQTLQLYGVGLTRTLGASIGGADALFESYTPVDPDRPDGFGTLSLWAVPPAPRNSQVILLGLDGLLISDPVEVIQRDIYEPNDSVSWHFAPPVTRISNPALALERVRRGDGALAVDWYSFTTTRAADWTISAWTRFALARFNVYVTNSFHWNSPALAALGFGVYTIDQDDWGVGTNFRPCDGLGFSYGSGEYAFTFEVPPDSAVIPLKNLPAGTYHVFVTYAEGGPFYDVATDVSGVAVFVDSLNLLTPLPTGLEIKEGYESILQPDQYEENDYCDVAASIPATGAVGALTIDSPHDADWFRFTVPPPGDNLQFGVDAADPDADLDIYVLRDFRPDSLVVVDLDFGAGAANVTDGAFLEPGDYLLVVVDFLGVPTEYTLRGDVLAVIPTQAPGVGTLTRRMEERRREAGVRRLAPELRWRR